MKVTNTLKKEKERQAKDFALYKIENGNEQFAATANAEANMREYKIIWVQEGSGLFYVKGHLVAAAPTAMYCIGPNQGYSFEPSEGCTGYLITFNSKFLGEHQDQNEQISAYRLNRLFRSHPVVPVDGQIAANMKMILLQLFEESQKSTNLSDEIQSKYMKLFLLYFVQQYINIPDKAIVKPHKTLSEKYIELVEEGYIERKSVAAYARELYVSANHLNKTVKDETGLSAKQHIQQKLIEKAKYELYFNGLSMKEVAFMLGFDDITHFSKCFKKNTGFNFSVLKKSLTSQFGIS